jgi:hypothetical protein
VAAVSAFLEATDLPPAAGFASEMEAGLGPLVHPSVPLRFSEVVDENRPVALPGEPNGQRTA